MNHSTDYKLIQELCLGTVQIKSSSRHFPKFPKKGDGNLFIPVSLIAHPQSSARGRGAEGLLQRGCEAFSIFFAYNLLIIISGRPRWIAFPETPAFIRGKIKYFSGSEWVVEYFMRIAFLSFVKEVNGLIKNLNHRVTREFRRKLKR